METPLAVVHYDNNELEYYPHYYTHQGIRKEYCYFKAAATQIIGNFGSDHSAIALTEDGAIHKYVRGVDEDYNYYETWVRTHSPLVKKMFTYSTDKEVKLVIALTRDDILLAFLDHPKQILDICILDLDAAGLLDLTIEPNDDRFLLNILYQNGSRMKASYRPGLDVEIGDFRQQY
ncbi:Hypothetical protein HVR_LOCUS451 [uncultured virus]|nr:Hypothetical protein HVR_LOCUS451 [uncultured virus]